MRVTNNNETMQKRLIADMKKKAQKPPKPKPPLTQKIGGGGTGTLDYATQIKALQGGGGDANTTQIINLLKETIGGFLFEQDTEANEWIISHNLNFRYVHINIFDDLGNIIMAVPNYVNNNRVDLKFMKPIKGLAVIRKAILI